MAARRSLGQHFLLDTNLTDRIVRAAGPLEGRNVVEIGPGPGGLTRALLASPAVRIVAVEIDPRAVAAMQELAGEASGRLCVIEANALEIDVTALVPPPKVDSAVVCLTPRPEQPEPALLACMERLTAAAFGQRRKMLRGALRPLGGEELLRKAMIAPDRRAETLSVAEFAALARGIQYTSK